MGRIFLDAEFSAVSKSMGRPLIQAELLGLLNSENGLCDILCGLGPGGELAEFLPSAAAAKALTAGTGPDARCYPACQPDTNSLPFDGISPLKKKEYEKISSPEAAKPCC